mmetsp:Transcript_23728/g.38101  ORF Transcript_23728/g.38101 Transcript_23728/m.38101 type:complete len:93 (-) Transcript_23728:102-380(-)
MDGWMDAHASMAHGPCMTHAIDGGAAADATVTPPLRRIRAASGDAASARRALFRLDWQVCRSLHTRRPEPPMRRRRRHRPSRHARRGALDRP